KQVNDALEKHPHPEIFNTDQGAQCTSEIHTQRLKKLGMTISMGDFFKPCPSKAKAGFKKSPSG
ncbi:hypothetical protein BSPLISOX_2510, partial [uncultured Gammaproteobacteria bacterium]